MSAKFCKSTINVGGEEKVIVQIQHTPDKEVNIPQKMHHIHLLDGSGSMAPHMDLLKKQVVTTLNSIPTDDLISLAWFSGEGEYQFIVKGVRADTPNLAQIIENWEPAFHLTCFSDILAELVKVISDTNPLCPNFNVTLFTDGEPCLMRRNLSQELSLVNGSLSQLYPEIVAFNTVGYGPRYNKELLQAWAQGSQFGVATHSNNIVEYLDIFQHNYEVINDLSHESVSVTVPKDCDILYMTKKFAKCRYMNYSLTDIDKKQNTFYLVLDKSVRAFDYQGEEYKVSEIKRQVSSPSVTNFLYAYAAHKYTIGKRREALDIIVKSLHDKYCAEMVMNSFTIAEMQFVISWLNKYALNKSLRHDEICTDDFIPDKNAFCALDLFQYLAKNPENKYVPETNYERIGLQTIDVDDKFSKVETVPASFSDFTFNKDKYNLSIRYTVNGSIKVNEDAAKKVKLGANILCKLYRYQTIVLDGALHVPKFSAIITQDAYKYLRAKAPVGTVIKDDIPDSKLMMAIIDLTKLPIVNMRYAELGRNTMDVYKLIKRQLTLEAQAKAIKALLNEDEETAYAGTPYTPEQIDFLATVGVSKAGVYNPVNRIYGKATDDDSDYYMARTLNIYVNKYSVLPSINAVKALVQKGSKLNLAASLVWKQYEDFKGLDVEALKKQKESVSEELMCVRYDLAGIKLAKLLNSDWYEGVTPDSEGKMLYAAGDDTLVFVPEVSKVYFTVSKK